MHRDAERTSDTDEHDAPRAVGAAVEAGACCDAAINDPRSRADIADRRLLAAMASGSRLAPARLHRGYFSRLVKFFAHLMPASAPEVVDDLIADTLFDAWQQRASLASDSSVRVAIMRIAWTHVSARLANGEAGRAAPGNLCGSREVFEALDPCARAIIHLVYSGHSRQEVADVLSIPCQAVDASLTSWRTSYPARLASSDAVSASDR